MGFLGKLFKGFVRSGVNQVGRDGGKVISNYLYQGKHATPISLDPNRQSYYHSSPIPRPLNVIWNVFMFWGWVFFLPQSTIGLIGYTAFLIPFFFIGRVWRPLANSHVHPRLPKNIYKSDRRFRSGARVIGSYRAPDKTINVPLESGEVRLYRVEGFLKLLILIASFGSMYFTTQTEDFILSNMDVTDKIELLQKGDTVFKNTKFIYYYAAVKNPNKSYKELAYDTIGIGAIFLSVDSIQTNLDTRSEMEMVKGSPEYKEFKPEFEIMFRVKPFVKLTLTSNEHTFRAKRLGGDWYVKPSDVRVGKKKIN